MPRTTRAATLRWIAAALVSALVITLVGGIWLYREQEQTLRRQAESELETIASLKSAEIVRWRGERLADAQRLAVTPGAREVVIEWLTAPSDENLEPVVQTLQSLLHGDRYADVLLVSTDGQMLASASGDTIVLQPEALSALDEAAATGSPILTDLHPDALGSTPHLDILTPIMASNDPGAAAVAAVLLRIDATQFLFPLIQTWPTTSETAETLLVRREGDEVLYLNDLRHAEDTALTLREPLNSPDVPAVKAALGERGIVEGRDYRGQEVLAFITAIPDTPWLMISKIDISEAFAGWQERSRYIVALVVVMSGVVLAAPALVVQRMRATEIKRDNERLEELVEERTADLHRTAEELTVSNERLEATVEELQSTNEELQATSEELMATTEELQQMNDELQYTSEELANTNEELAAASDAKSRFLRSISHEFRTPLNSIIGFSNIMRKGLAGEVNSEQQQQLDIIERSGHHLLGLINDVLDLSRIEAGRMELEIRRTNLNELVESLVDSMRPNAEQKGLELAFEAAERLPAARSYHSDPRRIRQIVLNLLGNAVKFTDAGAVTARVFRHSPGMIGISVTDTGSGIPEEDLDLVFEEFAQSQQPSNSAHLGTGLGLAISANLARLLGGTLIVESTVGLGSTFTLVLPERPDLHA